MSSAEIVIEPPNSIQCQFNKQLDLDILKIFRLKNYFVNPAKKYNTTILMDQIPGDLIGR